jgi:hypothetical protein
MTQPKTINFPDSDCEACKLKYCIPECFDRHRGSRIALGKIITEQSDKNKKEIYIAGD